MQRALALLALTFALTGCPSYDRVGKLEHQDGYTPADQYARYGQEQAQAVALGRTYAEALDGKVSVEARERAAGTVLRYAKSLPGVADIKVDTLGGFATVSFKSGWRTMVTPIADGKKAGETPNLPAGAGAGRAAPAKS
jgi:hypothetical protein